MQVRGWSLREFLTPGKLGSGGLAPGENPKRWYRIGGWGAKPPSYIGCIASSSAAGRLVDVDLI